MNINSLSTHFVHRSNHEISITVKVTKREEKKFMQSESKEEANQPYDSLGPHKPIQWNKNMIKAMQIVQ